MSSAALGCAYAGQWLPALVTRWTTVAWSGSVTAVTLGEVRPDQAAGPLISSRAVATVFWTVTLDGLPASPVH